MSETGLEPKAAYLLFLCLLTGTVRSGECLRRCLCLLHVGVSGQMAISISSASMMPSPRLRTDPA